MRDAFMNDAGCLAPGSGALSTISALVRNQAG